MHQHMVNRNEEKIEKIRVAHAIFVSAYNTTKKKKMELWAQIASRHRVSRMSHYMPS